MLTIMPAGAVRAGNVVTITTNGAHGLQTGSIVQVGSVTDSSFNGTQTVISVPSATTFTYNQAGANATSGNGVVSLLIQGDWATDAVLLPFANKAYRKVQKRMLQAGSKTMTNDVVLTPAMPVGMQILSDTSNPQLPSDFLAPRQLFERITGQQFFCPPMCQVDALPNCPQYTYNRVFSWVNDTIQFIGATSALDLRIRYFVGFPNLSDGTSQIQIRGGLDPVASQTAFLASNSRAPGSGNNFAAMFEEDIKELLNMQAHSRQYLPGRRRPANSARGFRFGYGGTV